MYLNRNLILSKAKTHLNPVFISPHNQINHPCENKGDNIQGRQVAMTMIGLKKNQNTPTQLWSVALWLHMMIIWLMMIIEVTPPYFPLNCNLALTAMLNDKVVTTYFRQQPATKLVSNN